MKGGVYWIGTEEHLSLRRHHNLLYLHARRQSFPTYQEIADALRADWPWGDFRCVADWVRHLGSRWSDAEVEAAVWKLVSEAAAAGRLLVDLTEVELDRTTPLAFLSSDVPPILLDPLPSLLEEVACDDEDASRLTLEAEEAPLEDQGVIPGPPFDASTLKSDKQRGHFHRNLAAATEVLAGGTLQAVAEKYDMALSPLWRLMQRVKIHGQLACVPRGTYQRARRLHPEFQQLIRKLYTQRKRPTIMEIYEDDRLKRLAEDLSQREGTLVLTPTYRQVGSFIKAIAAEAAVAQARSGLIHAPHERMSPHSFVLSIPAPALLC